MKPKNMKPKKVYIRVGSNDVAGITYYTVASTTAEDYRRRLKNRYPMVSCREVWLMTQIKNNPDSILVWRHNCGRDRINDEFYSHKEFALLDPDIELEEHNNEKQLTKNIAIDKPIKAVSKIKSKKIIQKSRRPANKSVDGGTPKDIEPKKSIGRQGIVDPMDAILNARINDLGKK